MGNGIRAFEEISMLSSYDIALGDFEKLALPCLNDLYRAASRFVRGGNQAEDLVQEAYLQAWKSFHRFAPGTNCRAWLFKILFHVIHHYWRRESSVRVVRESEEMLEGMLAYEPPVPECITDEDVLAALDKVPLAFREVLLLADVQEFAYKEISDILNIPLGTVMSRLSRGRRHLRCELLSYAKNMRIEAADQPQPCGA